MGVPINNVTRRVVYAASGTGPYAFTFEILAASDIAVYRDDTLLTLTTDYTVTINVNGTGSVTLTASPTGATQIAIVGNRSIQRLSDFVTGGDLFANTINDELDQQTIFNQQNAEGLQRSLQAPQTDPTSINMILPRASVRANKVLSFDTSGNPLATEFIGSNRGNWAAGTLYYVRDIIKDTTNNNIWQCNTQHTSSGSQPIGTNADAAKWTLLVDAASATSSATAAAASASAASTSATNAASSASAASTSASNAASSASTASTQASNASTSATNAASSATSAASSAAAAATSYDDFDDRYLGAKNSDPTLDNDGNALLNGALYFDNTNKVMKVYDLANTTWRRTTPTTSDQSNINTVSGISANVTTVAGISANVTTVAGISANVTTVAGNNSNVTTVATNIANVNSVGGNIANVNSVAGNATNINAAVSNATNINTVAGISANVTTVATNNANVTTVAGSIASVNTNATNIANINQNAANITAIQNASTNATNAAASATAAASSASAAAASAASASAVVLGNEPVRPGIRPSLLLDFANTKALDPRVTFTRSTTATYYDGVTTAKAEENLLTYSEQFDNADWSSKSNVTITANATAAPDGGTTADAVFETATTSSHFVARNVVGAAAVDYVVSVYAKAGNRGFVSIAFDSLQAWFNLSTGAVGTVEAGLTASISNAGSGWYRCSIRRTVAVAATKSLAIYACAADNAVSYAGDNSVAAIYLWGAQLEQRSSVTAYTATTTQAITNYIPVLQTAASGVPRFDHNPTTDESLGLLIEEQRTNLFTYSAQLDNAAWTKTRTSITADTIVAPDGTLTGDKVIPNTTSSTHVASVANSVTNGVSYTFSFYAKAGEYQTVSASHFNGAGGVPSAGTTWYVNLLNGSIIGTPSNWTITTAAVGNGWYRIAGTFTATATSSADGPAIYVRDNSGNLSYAGDGFSGIYVWGAQLEAGAFATSYIPTVASTVTRNADVASMTGTNFSSWYNFAEGAFYYEASKYRSGNNYSNLLLVRNTATSLQERNPDVGLGTGASGSAGVFRVDYRTNNVVQAALGDLTSFSANTFYKGATAYKVNDFASVVNGGSLATATSGQVSSTANTLEIGSRLSGSGDFLNGTIKKIAYYPLRVTNAQLQALTTV